jgi:hypothetical protein
MTWPGEFGARCQIDEVGPIDPGFFVHHIRPDNATSSRFPGDCGASIQFAPHEPVPAGPRIQSWARPAPTIAPRARAHRAFGPQSIALRHSASPLSQKSMQHAGTMVRPTT